MEIHRVPGLDFEELGFVSGVVILQKIQSSHFFKVRQSFMSQTASEVLRQEDPTRTTDRKLWVHFFQESLSGMHLEWFYQLEGTNIHNWEDLVAAFYKQYQYNADLAPNCTQFQNMSINSLSDRGGWTLPARSLHFWA